MKKNCANCKWCMWLRWRGFCILAKQEIPDREDTMLCDFWRPEKGWEYDNLHDHDAMVKRKQKNDQSLPDKE